MCVCVCDVLLVVVPSSQRRIRGFRAPGETRHVSVISRKLGPKVPKIEKSADLVHYFSGVVSFCVNRNPTSNLRGSTSGRLNWLFTGEIPQ